MDPQLCALRLMPPSGARLLEPSFLRCVLRPEQHLERTLSLLSPESGGRAALPLSPQGPDSILSAHTLTAELNFCDSQEPFKSCSPLSHHILPHHLPTCTSKILKLCQVIYLCVKKKKKKKNNQHHEHPEIRDADNSDESPGL